MGDYDSRKQRREDRHRSHQSESSSDAKSSSRDHSKSGKDDNYQRQLDDYQKYRESSPTPYDGKNKEEKNQRPREHAPNNTIILTNLPPNVDENWILYSLAELQVANIKELRLIRDRRTGIPKGFCFVEFFSIYDSQAFFTNFYPSIQIGDQKVYLNYSEPQSSSAGAMNAENPAEQNWTCYTCGFFNIRRKFDCYKCNSRKPLALNAHVLYSEANKGLSDVGSIPLHVLLIRQLDKDVTAEDLFKRFSELSTIRRAWIIRDRESQASWGFGFIEFWDVNTAGSILAKISNPDQLPDDFVLIPNHPPILPSFAQMTSFVLAETSSEWTVPGDQDTHLMYWDVRGYADQHPKELPMTYTEPVAKSEEKAPEVTVSKPTASVARTAVTSSVVSEQPQDNVRAQLAALYDKISKIDTDLVDINIPKPSVLNHTAKDPSQAASVPKKSTAPSASRSSNSKVQAQLNKWNQKMVELRQVEPSEPVEEKPSVPVSGPNAIPSNPYLKDLLDMEKKACLLCKRQFKNEEELFRHRDVSDMHKQNLSDPELVKKVQDKIKAKYGANALNLTTEEQQYRDRAQERRTLYNQPKNPPKSSNSFQQNKPSYRETVQEPSQPPAESVGSKLLKNMGWKEGQGLGRNMDGIVEPVKPESYGQGAGIGSAPKTNYEDSGKNLEYRERVKNAFRQRFFEEQ